MEPGDVVILFIFAVGVLALKAFLEVFLTLPIIVLYIVIALFFAFCVIGFFMLLGSKGEHVEFNFKTGFTFLKFEPKRALLDATALWLNWPWWAIMLLAWRLLQPRMEESARLFAKNFGFNLDVQVYFFGSPLVILSILLTYVLLVFITTLFMLVNPVPASSKRVGECPRCGTKHSIVDNYCSQCGGILQRKQ